MTGERYIEMARYVKSPCKELNKVIVDGDSIRLCFSSISPDISRSEAKKLAQLLLHFASGRLDGWVEKEKKGK